MFYSSPKKKSHNLRFLLWRYNTISIKAIKSNSVFFLFKSINLYIYIYIYNIIIIKLISFYIYLIAWMLICDHWFHADDHLAEKERCVCVYGSCLRIMWSYM